MRARTVAGDILPGAPGWPILPAVIREKAFMDRIEAMKVFVAALDEGSLAGAGRRLGRSAAAVSRAIAFLENQVGAELLHRTTRSIKLSEVGERYASACRRVLVDVEEAEMAAAGLWTTASDLARFAIGVQAAVAGKSNPVISQSMARQMLTKQKGDAGLGLFLESEGPGLVFMHNGRDEGFDAAMVASAHNGFGVVIMINANDDSNVCKEIIEAIVKEYH